MIAEDLPIDKRSVFKMPNKETIKLFMELEYPNIVSAAFKAYPASFTNKRPVFLNNLQWAKLIQSSEFFFSTKEMFLLKPDVYKYLFKMTTEAISYDQSVGEG